MRKLCIFIFGILLFIFLIPVLFTKKFSTVGVSGDMKFAEIGKSNNGIGIIAEEMQNKGINEENEKNENENNEIYKYKKYGTINLLDSITGEKKEIELDEYLYGVVSAEMPANFEIEALKAQAVVARTYTIYTISHNKDKHGDNTICNDSSCCQAWISKDDRFSKWTENERETNWNKIVEAVNSTKGQIIEYNGEPIDAFFHSNSGGKTEIPVNVWGGTNYPYLQVVETSGEDGYSQYSSEVKISKTDLEQKMKEKYSDFSIDWNNKDCIKISEFTDSGRARAVVIGNKDLSGVEVRSIFGLKSANFKIEFDNNEIKFSVVGYGHGVGMSQTGADSMAKQGANYKDIINHFYKDIEIVYV